MVRGSKADTARATRPRGRAESRGCPRGQRVTRSRRSHPGVIRGARRDLETFVRRAVGPEAEPSFPHASRVRTRARGAGRSRKDGSEPRTERQPMNHPQQVPEREREPRRGGFPPARTEAHGRVASLEHPGARALGGEKEFVSGVLRWVRGRGDSWGTSVRTVHGVLVRSGPRGPGPAALEGGETRLRLGRGPELVTAFPPPLFQGKESEASSRAIG